MGSRRGADVESNSRTDLGLRIAARLDSLIRELPDAKAALLLQNALRYVSELRAALISDVRAEDWAGVTIRLESARNAMLIYGDQELDALLERLYVDPVGPGMGPALLLKALDWHFELITTVISGKLSALASPDSC